MGLLCLSVFMLASSWRIVTSEYNPAICRVIKESHGPVPPPIPRDFEARYEVVDYDDKEISYAEFYYDYSNGREKYVDVTRGIEHHFLFDYDQQQIVTYDLLHPGVNIKKDPISHVCDAIDMDDFVMDIDFSKEIAGFKYRMRSSNEDLVFGGRHSYAYDSTFKMDQRGVVIDKFVGCVYDDEVDVTMNVTYYFTSKKDLGVGTSAGTLESEVTGIDNGFLSVPARADYYGAAFDDNSKEMKVSNHTLNYFWFKGEPEFKMDTFKIPPYLYCKNYRGRKQMPKFPIAFETRIQKTVLVRDIFGKLATSELNSFENIMYYKDKNLARRDFTPGDQDTDIKSKFNTMSPVRTVYDFNEGLLYTTNIASGRCYIRPIIVNDFFEAGSYITLATPEHIFQMEADNMEYKGKDFTRDIECDVWSGRYFNEKEKANFSRETYISTNGWHVLADELAEYGVPIKHTIIQNELNGELVEGVLSYSFLKFKAKAPLLRTFDISNCIETENTKDFALFLTISEEVKQKLFTYKVHFLDTVQYYLTQVTQLISPLRVQRLQLRILSKAKPKPAIFFTLVDKIKLKTKIPVGQPGSTLDEAIVNLRNFIDKNQFFIQFYPPYSKEMVLVPALRGDLYVRKGSGDLTYYAPMEEISVSSSDVDISRKEHAMPEIQYDDPSAINGEESEGMTPGGLAFLSLAMLFIGIGIGIAVMYLYFRYTSERRLEDRIQLSLKTAESGEKEADFIENAQ